MKFFVYLLRHSSGLVGLAGLVGLCSGAVNAKLISLISDNLNRGEGQPETTFAFFGILVIVALITGALSQSLLVFISEKIACNLRLNMSAQILGKSLRDSEEVGGSRLLATFTQDIPTITRALIEIPSICINGSITIGCLFYLGFLSPQILVYLVIFLVFALISFLIPESFAVKLMEANREAYDGMIERFKAMIDGFKELKLHYRRRETFFNSHLRDASHQVRRTGFRYQVLYALLDNWTQLLYFVFVALLIFVMPLYQTMDARAISGFAITVLYMSGPVSILVNAIPNLRKAGVAFNKVERLGMRLDGKDTGDPFANKETVLADLAAAPKPTTIKLEALTHTFYREREERHFTLGPIDFEVKAGECVFMVGGNGSGKTTLAKLICGLYLPEGGRLLFNGQPVTEENLELYRQNFSAIFTDFYLFEQIMGMDSDHLDDRAAAYLRELQLDHKVSVKGGRLSTTALSTGQRKRLALLTAYLEDRPIYIFDEWAADQDPEFKNVFYQHLLPELKERGKTAFVISHDDRYFHLADRVIKLADGQLTPYGESIMAST